MNDELREKRFRKVITVSVITLVINLILGAVKVYFGSKGHASALMADGVHSVVDAATTAVLIYALAVSGSRKGDKRADLVIYSAGLLAALIGTYIIAVKLGDMVSARFVMAYVPAWITAIVAAVSVVIKGIMAFVTMKVAGEAGSVNLKLDGKQHLWDALSSVIALAGILIAGYFVRIADSVACILVAIFIIKSGMDFLLAAARSLENRTEVPELENRIGSLLELQPDVKAVRNVDVDLVGDDYYVSADVYADPSLTLEEAAGLAARLTDIVEFEFTQLKDCRLAILPFEE